MLLDDPADLAASDRAIGDLLADRGAARAAAGGRICGSVPDGCQNGRRRVITSGHSGVKLV